MIILDTNVVSAIMAPDSHRAVVTWLNRRPLDSLWLTAITVLEVQFGLELMAYGRALRERSDAFDRLLNDKFRGRILPFDAQAALQAAKFVSLRRAVGKPVEFRDLEIAGIVALQSATLATRNVRDFEGFSLDIVNPWNP